MTSNVTNPQASDGSQAQPASAAATSSQPTGSFSGSGGISGSPGTISSSTRIGSLAQLSAMSPQLVQEMLVSIATTIVNQMQDNEEKRKELAKEYEDDNG